MSDPLNTPWRKMAVTIFDAPSEASATCTMEIDVTDLEAYRRTARRPGMPLRLVHFFVAATARAIEQDAPIFNCYVQRGRIRQRERLDVVVTGIIPGTTDLVDLTIRDAHQKTVYETAEAIQAMVSALRSEDGRKMVRDKYALSRIPWPFRRWTFRLLRWLAYDLGIVLPGRLEPERTGAVTISDLSRYVTTEAHGALFPGAPQAALLVLNRPQERPVVREGQVVPRTMMKVSLTGDHRLFDASHVDRLFTGIVRRLNEPQALTLPPSNA